MPFPRHNFKAVCSLFAFRRLLGLLGLSMVDPVGKMLSSFIPSSSCFEKGYSRKGAKRQKFFFTMKTVLEPPVTA